MESYCLSLANILALKCKEAMLILFILLKDFLPLMHAFSTKEEAAEHLRTKFTSAHETRELMEKYDIVLKRGEYNSYEASVVDKVIRDFLEKRRLSMKNLHAFFLDEDPCFPIRELLVMVSNALECRALSSVWIYVSYHYHPYVDAKWEPENEIQLLNLVKVMGFKWKEICGIMNKTSRKCITNYYRIMGFGYIYKYNFKLPEEGIPTTEEEWDSLCRKMKTNRKRLSHVINGYISNKLVVPFWNEYNNMMLIAYVIFYNHFCSVKIGIPELLEFIDNGAKKELPEGKSMERSEIYGEVSRFIPDLGDYCLDIPIDIDDIFWRTIKVFMGFSSGLLRSRFVQISKVYGVRMFGELLNVFRNMVVDCYLYKIKDRLKEEIDKIVNSKTRKRKSSECL